MVGMLLALVRTALLAGSLLPGLPWIRSSSTVPPGQSPASPSGAAPAAAATAAPNRVALMGADAPEYTALAIPKSYKSQPDATLRLLVFRDGLCIRDRGLVQAHETRDGGNPGATIMEETGVTERGAVAPDGREAVIATTRYVSRVDLTPGQTSTAGDTVTGATTLTLIDPAHPEGRWRVTLENGRWIKELLVLPASMGVVATTFLPRLGPTDVRILDATGRETIRVPESAAQTMRLETAPRGGYVAAEMAFPEGRALPWQQGVMVFDIAGATQWTYGWRYGSDDEPMSWSLQDGGVLVLKLASGTRRFDPTGRRL